MKLVDSDGRMIAVVGCDKRWCCLSEVEAIEEPQKCQQPEPMHILYLHLDLSIE
jgi:hypothetical protein